MANPTPGLVQTDSDPGHASVGSLEQSQVGGPHSYYTPPTPSILESGQHAWPPSDTSTTPRMSTSNLQSGPSNPSATLPRRRSMFPGSRRITSSLRRLASNAQQANQPRWTVFGQLMENEGQLKIDTLRTRASNLSGRDPVEQSPLGMSEADDPFASGFTVHSSGGTSVQDSSLNSQSPTSRNRESLELIADTDVDYDSDDSDFSSESPLLIQKDTPASLLSPSSWPTLPVLYRNILKCAIAYYLASLFTFVPYLSGLISDVASPGTGDRRPSPSGHMVATVAVYFNPAKSIGGMLEADSYCLGGLAYSAFVCLGSMSMFWYLEVKPGWEWLAEVVVILWIGVSMSALTWLKVRVGKPAFNTACSMTAIILFVVIVKEGGVSTMLQVTFIIFVGAIVSNVVCYAIWPQSATKTLHSNMNKTLASFSTLLQLLVGTFLLEDASYLSPVKLQRAIESHQSSFTTLKQNLAEAHSEWLFGGPRRPTHNDRESSGQAYEDAVASLNRLGQHLSGLRSGTSLQYDLAKAHKDGKVNVRGRKRGASVMEPTLQMGRNGKGKIVEDSSSAINAEEEAMLKAAAVMFGDLVDDLGPPLTALSVTCTSTLQRLREIFIQLRASRHPSLIQPREFLQLADSIERAMFTFESTSNHALLRLFRTRDNLVDAEGAKGLTARNDYESVFLVYFFIFTLQEFAQELISLVDAIGRIYSIERLAAARRSWWNRLVLNMFGCLRFSSHGTRRTGGIEKAHRKGINRISSFILPEIIRKPPAFPKVRPHAPNTIQTPARSKLTFIGRMQQSLWALGARLKESDLKYAVKAGMATAILAAPAFFESTRPIFTQYKGEWALISFFVVISPTIGGTNFMGIHRVLGTLFGAVTAFGIYSAFSEDPLILSIFGFFYSLPCFYVIVAKPQYAATGRFVLLTYNLTCLYCYNLRDKDVLVRDVAFHRFIAVTVGVVWAWLVSRFWWPSEARRELSKALSEFCLNLGWLYTRLVASYSAPPAASNSSQTDGQGAGSVSTEGRSVLHRGSSESIEEFMAMELHLQIKLIEMQNLLAQAQHEPRLKGPFPVALYRSILTSLQAILDKLHSNRCVTTREEWFTEVRRDFILPVNKERREMVGNVILYLSTLSSAFQLKAPLPPYLPPAEKSRQRLVDAIRNLDVVKSRDVKGSRHLLFFAYTLTMKSVIQELDYLGRTLQDAFGVIGQTTDEFEALFMGDSRPREEYV